MSFSGGPTRDVGERAHRIVGSDRLDRRRGQADHLSIIASLDDAAEELEELRRVDDRVGDARAPG